MAVTGPFQPKPSSRALATVQISTAADGRSDIINLTGLTLSSIQMSTAWTAAAIGLRASIDGSTANMNDVYGSTGDLYYFTTTASRTLIFDPSRFAGLQTIQLVSMTTAGVAVAQTATRTIKLGLSEFVNAD